MFYSSLQTFKKDLNQKTSNIKVLEKRCMVIKGENPDAEDVSVVVEHLQERRQNLEDSLKERDEVINFVIAQSNILKEEMMNLSNGIQRLSNDLSVDCQVNRPDPHGLKSMADITQVFTLIFVKKVFSKETMMFVKSLTLLYCFRMLLKFFYFTFLEYNERPSFVFLKTYIYKRCYEGGIAKSE